MADEPNPIAVPPASRTQVESPDANTAPRSQASGTASPAPLHRSRYTVTAPGATEGEALLYHTATGAFAAVSQQVVLTLAEGAGPHAHELAQAGFLTHQAPEEELAAQARAFAAQRADARELTLALAPTYRCNYRCPYCYEQGVAGIPGVMDQRVQDAVAAFVEAEHGREPFSQLAVQWYGGDPSLALGVVEALSARLATFCAGHGAAYRAMMLTNCNLIDDAAADLLVRAHVEEVLVTIDGFEETHNARRVAADGSNSFERNIAAVRAMTARGITVHATMNVDRVNWPQYHDLRDWLAAEAGCDLQPGRLCDYGRTFGEGAFAPPAFDLFTHEEFCHLQHAEAAAGGLDAGALREMLAPCPRFCNGQRDRYFVVDVRGDVYPCDGYVGHAEHVRFNVLDPASTWRLHDVSHDPHESAQCRECELLPVCQGNCDWERRATGMVCHPLKLTLPDYLRDWRSCFGPAQGDFELLAPARR